MFKFLEILDRVIRFYIYSRKMFRLDDQNIFDVFICGYKKDNYSYTLLMVIHIGGEISF